MHSKFPIITHVLMASSRKLEAFSPAYDQMFFSTIKLVRK